MIVVLVIYGLLALAELVLVIRFTQLKDESQAKGLNDYPVSILVCARDEEENLPRCIESLLSSNYEMSQVEILIGDDNSTDNTWQLIKSFESWSSAIKGVKIQEQKDGLVAKGNVLAQLVDQASHEKVLIIDADMKVSNQWISTMCRLLNSNDLISGLTMVDKDFHRPRIQYFDWAVVLHSMKSMSDLWQPISILGNNMGFNKSTYERVGGFRALGPTDVEDLGILRLFQKARIKTHQYLGVEGKAYTKAQKGWNEMLEQRTRWINGVFTHHWVLAIPALFARLWFLVFLVLISLGQELSYWVMLYGLVFNLIKYWQVTTKVKNRYQIGISIPPIISLLDTFALLRIAFRGKASWKGRRF